MAYKFDTHIWRGQKILLYTERKKEIDTLVNHAVD